MPTKTLVLMRHSYAASNNYRCSDRDRPLTSQGRRLAERTANLLSEFRFNCIIHSAAVRTSETAAIVKAACPASTQIHSVASLYLAPAADYARAPAQFAIADDNVVLLIGHNPGISMLINSWVDESLAILPGSVAIFEVSGNDWRLDTPDAEMPQLIGFISEGERLK